MLQQPSIGAFVPWTPPNGGASLGPVEIKTYDTPVPRSIFHGQKFQVRLVCTNTNSRLRPEIFCCGYRRTNYRRGVRKHEILPQNVDLPPVLPKKKKKPFPIPLKKIQEAAREDKRLAQMGIEKPLEPPRNGILVPDLIPVAYEVLDAWKVLISGLAQLLHVVPVHACSECSEIHVAQIGHKIQDCHGPTSGSRRSYHSWIKGSINDVLTPIESYHMYDPYGRRIKHETRFSYDRIPAVVELCIQAGVELPEYPSRRRTEPIRMLGKKVIDIGGYVDEPTPFQPGSPGSQIVELDTYQALERFPPPTEQEVPRVAQATINAYEKVRWGVTKLMRKYRVKACGYCSEVHVGPWGHNAKLCGEFKHQWRDGKHGWQDATVDEVFPPNYVWHVEDPKGPQLKSALKSFYGKAPAVVEVCVQAGARVPNKYKPMMRVDIVVPEDNEARFVA
ncbi:APO protein 1, chloroplastic-like isoform X1 [Salvia miltiorrhiza]|uniref:APO protein 1, chloroplastic-like isoform X1 n=1 Tax=Salvia miltiorrhiza TaxID=226208 RepID=UPI0025AC91B2|nr:APO protein 1, chloroplastic-like isoform X1 [Salvia miltiorrhiza]XP_057777452.1 APO protein 1, chloroplastic-like isoform X1 [Salvia miltiorrhiza]XP_057777460.1 APO protein 1, chloroplastic-like isoform X1 [Salvia miltiorrhiza]XP_057777469.1 APO protein 1, chloroplastic-like isoform X1 [Salvia miltiorrhiza]